MSEFTHDVFICHASEDKDDVARKLATHLKTKGIETWFDEFSLKWGDRLMKSIQKGLKNSLFGVVIFSPNFFKKKWTELELDTLVQLTDNDDRKILPLLYNMTHDELKNELPMISGIVARSWDDGLEKLSDEILEIVKENKKIPDTFKAVFKNVEMVDSVFRNKFENILDKITNSLENHTSSDINDSIDIAIMLVKERIEKWDVPSVKYSMERLFDSLYEYSSNDGDGSLNELHVIFKDLFQFAYKQREHLIGSMVGILSHILFKNWLDEYDLEKAEKALRLLLRIAIDFIPVDIKVTKDCANAITNMSGDMFEDEIYSKEILLGAYLYELNSKTEEQDELLDEILNWIKWDDRYSHDAGRLDYLKCGIAYADSEKDDFGIQFTDFKQNCLMPISKENMNKEINGFMQFLGETELDKDDLSFDAELLSNIIDAYNFVEKDIIGLISTKVSQLKQEEQEYFKKIIEFDEDLMKQFQSNS